MKDESTSEDYSSIIQNGNSKFEDSWNMESKMLLSNLSQLDTSQPFNNISCEEIIVEVNDEDYH